VAIGLDPLPRSSPWDTDRTFSNAVVYFAFGLPSVPQAAGALGCSWEHAKGILPIRPVAAAGGTADVHTASTTAIIRGRRRHMELSWLRWSESHAHALPSPYEEIPT